MKLIAVISAVLSLSVFAETPLPRNWQPIIGAPAGLFYDRNIIKEGTYASGSILLSSDTPKPIIVDNKQIMTRSLVKSYVMDCETGTTIAYLDRFYSVPKPTINSSYIS